MKGLVNRLFGRRREVPRETTSEAAPAVESNQWNEAAASVEPAPPATAVQSASGIESDQFAEAASVEPAPLATATETAPAIESHQWAEAAAYVERAPRGRRARWLGFPVAIILGATIGWSARPLPSDGTTLDAREHYYRGVYDVCRSVMGYPDELCREALRNTIDHDWFEDPTPGWTWPLPELNRFPNQTPQESRMIG